MELTPDELIFFEYGFIKLNGTILFTWIVMTILVLFAWIAGRNINSKGNISKKRQILEIVVIAIRKQIAEITRQKPEQFLYFLGSLYLFLALANFLSFVPYYHPPTGSLSTTAALAVCVFFAVPFYGIKNKGIKEYLKHYIDPTPFMLPFKAISEISRTIALAIRLFGNIMSGSLLVAIILTIAPLFFPVILQALELLIGQVQAYIFAVLAAVYIGSSSRAREKTKQKSNK